MAVLIRILARVLVRHAITAVAKGDGETELSPAKKRVVAVASAGVVALGGIAFVSMRALSGNSGAAAAQSAIVPPAKNAAATTTVATTTTAAATTTSAPLVTDKVPSAVAAQLIDHEVTVVEIYDPGTNRQPVVLDQQAAIEARSGAEATGAGYAAINVRDDDAMQRIGDLVPVNADPFLFIVDRNGKVLFQRAGYVDRDVVAQAATNALAGANASDPQPFGQSDGIAGPYDGYWKAQADDVVCQHNDAIGKLGDVKQDSIAMQISVIKAILNIDAQTLTRLRAIKAVGPDAGAYGAMVGAFAHATTEYQQLLAIAGHKPLAVKAYNKQALQLSSDWKQVYTLEKKVGVGCFKKPADSSAQ